MGGLIGGVVGGIGGAFANQKNAGQDAGNIFNIGGNASQAQQQLAHGVNDTANTNLTTAANAVQNNPIYSSLFGNGGTLNQAQDQLRNAQNTGSLLTNTDLQAYGQASDNIARQFGQSDQSLAQALSDRGLSNSGVAGAQFSNSLGNRNEALANLQTQIAQNRQLMNQQLMGQTQQFISQLGAQAQGAVGQSVNEQNTQANNEFNQGMGMLGAIQGQNNSALGQRQQTQTPGVGSNITSGILGGMAAMGGSGGGGKGSSGGYAGRDTTSAMSSLFT